MTTPKKRVPRKKSKPDLIEGVLTSTKAVAPYGKKIKVKAQAVVIGEYIETKDETHLYIQCMDAVTGGFVDNDRMFKFASAVLENLVDQPDLRPWQEAMCKTFTKFRKEREAAELVPPSLRDLMKAITGHDSFVMVEIPVRPMKQDNSIPTTAEPVVPAALPEKGEDHADD